MHRYVHSAEFGSPMNSAMGPQKKAKSQTHQCYPNTHKAYVKQITILAAIIQGGNASFQGYINWTGCFINLLGNVKLYRQMKL